MQSVHCQLSRGSSHDSPQRSQAGGVSHVSNFGGEQSQMHGELRRISRQRRNYITPLKFTGSRKEILPSTPKGESQVFDTEL